VGTAVVPTSFNPLGKTRILFLLLLSALSERLNNLYAVYSIQIYVKTIMIKDEVYQRLSKIKGKKSFSELLDELVYDRKEAKLAAFEKIRGILSDKEADEVQARIKKMRESFRLGPV
jgi:predicted CopG family antitoxin